jgi:hypothetical protein
VVLVLVLLRGRLVVVLVLLRGRLVVVLVHKNTCTPDNVCTSNCNLVYTKVSVICA